MLTSWSTKSSRVVYDNPWIIVHEDTVIRPDGNDGLYGYVECKSPAVFVVPIDRDGDTYIVQQERYTTKKIGWECVAGRMDNQSVDVAAKRELLEETGLSAQSVHTLGKLDTANGVTSFNSIVCIAEGLEKVTDNLDEVDGIIACKKLSFSEVKRMIINSEITCSESIAAFFLAMSYVENK